MKSATPAQIQVVQQAATGSLHRYHQPIGQRRKRERKTAKRQRKMLQQKIKIPMLLQNLKKQSVKKITRR